MSDPCKHCGSNDTEKDPNTGQTVCCECGVVLAEDFIVSEVQFVENAQGFSSAVGNFVSHDDIGPRNLFQDRNISISSRQLTYSSGKKQIDALCIQLRTDSLIPGAALMNFKMSVSKGITNGRKRVHVIAACVYLACRTFKSHLMLIDVSDAVQTDVFEVGRTYLKLMNALCIQLPAIDPCLYMIRFAHRLEFGDMENTVCTTAVRLVERMKKDSLHTGRRPSGICGAALIIAARFHNFNRTIQDVIRVVRVHESTVRKRLMEFGDTKSSELTHDEFMNNDMSEAEDPPSFKAARKREEEQIQKLLDQDKDLTKEFTNMRLEIEKVLNERKNKLRMKHATADVAVSGQVPLDQDVLQRSDKEASDAVQFIAESTMESIQECMSVDGKNLIQQDNSMPDILPTTSSMGLKQSIEESMQTRPSEPVPEETGILDLDGIDDDEIDSYILTDREKESKTSFWMSFNKAYLDEVEKKKEVERLEEEERIKNGLPPKKRIQKKRKKSIGPANTAGEAMERMLKVKKLSSKIDYSVLKNLNSDEKDDCSDTHSIVSKASSRSSRSSKSSSRAPAIPAKFCSIMQSLTKANSPSEATHRELDAECEAVPLFKKHKLLDVASTAELHDEASSAALEEDEHDDDFDDEDDDDGKENLVHDEFLRHGSDEDFDYCDDF